MLFRSSRDWWKELTTVTSEIWPQHHAVLRIDLAVENELDGKVIRYVLELSKTRSAHRGVSGWNVVRVEVEHLRERTPSDGLSFL